MDCLQSLPWADPLDYAAALDAPDTGRDDARNVERGWEQDWTLLYSGVQAGYSGRYSLLAWNVAESVEDKGFEALRRRLTADAPRFANAWFGYLGYGLKNALEDLPRDTPGWANLPPLSFRRFHTVLEFDHQARSVALWSDLAAPHLPAPATAAAGVELPPLSGGLRSNMSRAEYLSRAEHLIARIHAGDLYQANLTRKFTGRFAAAPRPFDVFRRLCAVSPAPYSAFLKQGDTAVISSSPELFLKMEADGRVSTRPIKGTAPRFPDPAQDRASLAKLAASAKDRAENLMIIDLMRNDLARSCMPGSVAAHRLFEVTSHSNVHHMSGTVTGRRRADVPALDVIAAAFPPGSMTGAPKVMAMRVLSGLERDERGVYSGALGWLGGDGSAELSVVIRTLLLRGAEFEFQVGGGIVADSTPEGELQEMTDKAGGILTLLGLEPGALP